MSITLGCVTIDWVIHDNTYSFLAATAVDRPAQSAAARVADEPATKVGKKAASLRAEVDQAGAAMSITGDVDLTEGHNVPKPRVPSEVEWVAKDVESLSLDELKAMETRDA